MNRFTVLLGLMFLCNLACVQATQKLNPPTIEQLNFQKVTLEQALDEIRALSRKDDPEGVGINIVLIKQNLAPIQQQSRFSLQAEKVLYRDLLYAISKRLGLGFRIEQHAVVVDSGNKIALPPPKSEAAEALSRKIKLELKFSE